MHNTCVNTIVTETKWMCGQEYVVGYQYVEDIGWISFMKLKRGYFNQNDEGELDG